MRKRFLFKINKRYKNERLNIYITILIIYYDWSSEIDIIKIINNVMSNIFNIYRSLSVCF